MKTPYSKLAMIGLAFAAMSSGIGMGYSVGGTTPKVKPPKSNYDSYPDMVMAVLASKGACRIDNGQFIRLRDCLQSKMRGQVLFHSDITTRQIFITYIKYKPL